MDLKSNSKTQYLSSILRKERQRAFESTSTERTDRSISTLWAEGCRVTERESLIFTEETGEERICLIFFVNALDAAICKCDRLDTYISTLLYTSHVLHIYSRRLLVIPPYCSIAPHGGPRKREWKPSNVHYRTDYIGPVYTSKTHLARTHRGATARGNVKHCRWLKQNDWRWQRQWQWRRARRRYTLCWWRQQERRTKVHWWLHREATCARASLT